MLKTLAREIRKNKIASGYLQTTSSVFLDIFYPPHFGYCEEMDFFNTPRPFRKLRIGTHSGSMREKAISLQLTGEQASIPMRSLEIKILSAASW